MLSRVAEIPLEPEDYGDIIREPASLAGITIAQQWADETRHRDWYYSQICSFVNETSESKIGYETERKHLTT